VFWDAQQGRRCPEAIGRAGGRGWRGGFRAGGYGLGDASRQVVVSHLTTRC
jgi:hypothetical protein